jgi:multidrug efflux pump subunit AcrA (membrane-fusion protein)
MAGVFQVKDDWAVKTPVDLGQRIGNLVAIKQGLKEGDKVIGKIDEIFALIQRSRSKTNNSLSRYRR